MEKLLSIINTVLENRGKNTVKFISEESSLKSDIGFDSLDLAELTVRIEAEYDIDNFTCYRRGNNLVGCRFHGCRGEKISGRC